MTPVVDSVSDKILIAEQKRIIEFNENDLTVSQAWLLEKLHTLYLETGKYKFYARGYETIVTDEQNKGVAIFVASKNSRLWEGKLYDIESTCVRMIDMAGFLDNR